MFNVRCSIFNNFYYLRSQNRKPAIMKKLLLLFALTLALSTVNAQQSTSLLGTWSGKLNLGNASLTLVLHITQADDNVVVTMDSPDQNVNGIPVFKEFLSDDSLAVKVEQLFISYRASLKEDKLCGTFTQAGVSLPLDMVKGVDELKRPQVPTPPYPYVTEEVTFCNAADGATLAGTLTWPVGYDKTSKDRKPVVALMVTGSGQENRDEEIYDHKPFLVIADYLARQGIATLRYDDRATGASVGGEVRNATTEDFARDAAAGMDFLRSKDAFSKVGIIGHSEGGSIAFMLGAKGKTDFIVSLAGPGVKGDTLLAAQANRILALSDMPADMTVDKYRQQQAVQDIPWIRWFIDYDPSADIAATRCPVFALNGDRDVQVISSQNLTAIERLLPKTAGNLFKQYPGLNHLFQHCATGLPTESRQIEETISPEVLSDIAQWINTVVASPSANNTKTNKTMNNTKNIYNFTVLDGKGQPLSLASYEGKVLLVVNTASRCGFTPQYNELEAMYKELHAQGFEILDFPCNQFGNQAPETDEEYTSFCQLNYKTEFPQLRKLEVNGPNESPLYTWLKAERGFAGFNPQHKLTPILEKMFDQADPEWRTKSDIKWNFTKFLIDRQGNVVERFEPTATADDMLPAIKQQLSK